VTDAQTSYPQLLAGKRVLVTGVLTPKSIAFAIAEAAQRAGARVVLTSFGRAMSLTERSARRLDPAPEVLELDVTSAEQTDAVARHLQQRWGGLDAAVHAVGFARSAATSWRRPGGRWPPRCRSAPSASRPWPAPSPR
jgi:meromycolic acid enoyl-[acyl-carrier-protein] reductase